MIMSQYVENYFSLYLVDVMESLLSRRDHHPPFFVTLSLLCGLLSRHIAASESDLLAASMTAPMYGILQSIRAIFEQEPASTLESCREHLRETLGRLVETCRVLSEVVSPVVCSSSPEGFLPDAPRGGVSRLLEEEKEEEGEGVESDRGIGGNAQSLLLCCWHTMKEVSLLLGLLVQHFSVPMEDQLSPPPLLTSQQVRVT